jgi:hypothetical protein
MLLDKPVPQPTTTRGNRCQEIVAPKVAGWSPVGHPRLQACAPEAGISSTILFEPGAEDRYSSLQLWAE